MSEGCGIKNCNCLALPPDIELNRVHVKNYFKYKIFYFYYVHDYIFKYISKNGK